MKVNKNKVFILPKAIDSAERNSICPCPICIEKVQKEEGQYYNLQEVKNSIEQILNSTSLYSKDFQIDISYANENTKDALKDRKIRNKVKELSEISKYLVQAQRLISQFEKLYRHPAVCELRENTHELILESNAYIEKYQTHDISTQRLWQLQNILAQFTIHIEIVREIVREDFIEHERIMELLARAESARKDGGRKLKEIYISSLSEPSYESELNSNDFSAEYGYE